MTHLKLSYFDVNGGRAEPIRLALYIGSIAFEDHRFSFAEFPQERAKTPLSQVPVIEVNQHIITQSNAILRYVGKQSGLYPTDNYQALLCDEILDAVEDCTNKIVPTLSLSGKELQVARETLAETDLPKYLRFFQEKLEQNDGQWFTKEQLTIAELKITALISWLNSGGLDHIPTDLVKAVAPKLLTVVNNVMNDDRVVAYYKSLAQ